MKTKMKKQISLILIGLLCLTALPLISAHEIQFEQTGDEMRQEILDSLANLDIGNLIRIIGNLMVRTQQLEHNVEYWHDERACGGTNNFNPNTVSIIQEVERTHLMGDANCDGVVSASDMPQVHMNFGKVCDGTEDCCYGDANNDRVVSAGDMAVVQSNFGTTQN